MSDLTKQFVVDDADLLAQGSLIDKYHDQKLAQRMARGHRPVASYLRPFWIDPSGDMVEWITYQEAEALDRMAERMKIEQVAGVQQ